LLKNQLITIAIIGSGPAGCAVAHRFLNMLKKASLKKHRIEIKIFDANRQIATGESIPPAASHALHEIGIAQNVFETHLSCSGSQSIWGSNTTGYNDFFHFPEGQGYHLDRALFNQQLKASLKRKNLTFYPNHQLSKVVPESTGYRLYFKESHFLADYVIDASGYSASFSRRIGVARNILDQVISLAIIIKNAPKNMAQQTFVEAVETGWWYLALLPNNQLILSFCSDYEIIKANGYDDIKQWRSLLSQSQLMAKKIPLDIISDNEKIIKRVAPSSILSQVIGQNWLAVGDAASSYDSISAAGITKALQQGIKAGTALFELIENNNQQAFADYQDLVFSDFNRYLKLRYDIYKSETRFSQAPFWSNRFKIKK